MDLLDFNYSRDKVSSANLWLSSGERYCSLSSINCSRVRKFARGASAAAVPSAPAFTPSKHPLPPKESLA